MLVFKNASIEIAQVIKPIIRHAANNYKVNVCDAIVGKHKQTGRADVCVINPIAKDLVQCISINVMRDFGKIIAPV